MVPVSPTPRQLSVANVEIQQFAASAGAYGGLLESPVPTHASSGLVTIALTRTGAFTAKGMFLHLQAGGLLELSINP